jgi:serine/threonine protein kinase/Tfp pilus assembly protein PilF
MRKKPIFSLDPDQLERLLSLGTGDPAPVEEQERQTDSRKPGIDREDAARGKESTPGEKEPSVNATASLVGVEQPGSQIGRYKLLSVLGEGGMGVVYLAEQEEPIRRRLALKVIKPGMDSRRVIARFEAERQALALLDHPNIAHVYDAGTTETGRPYFVMEYVKGLPITGYCDHHKLTIEDRLRLFQQVCLAVHHAHQKGIIHRDIKPSNILVSTQDDKVVPKIIDFGVAKAISQPLTERTLLTEDSQLLGTPEYMSPEQADMATEDIDTRSDIYSLGVLLYVLLTGVLPFDSDALRTGGIERIRQVIRETDPKTPSTRVSKLGEKAKKVAELRRTEIRALAKHLKKELEWIPLKAMRKERAERYRSASEFADDIENYLEGAPLIAGPLSNIYRLKKFVHRNRALVSGIAAILTVLVAGIIVSMLFAIGQARARAQSEATADFFASGVLSAVSRIKGRDATAADVLDVASKNLDGKFDDQPVIEALICRHLGTAYLGLGDYRSAITQLARSYQLRRAHLGEGDGATQFVKNYLALAYWWGGHYSNAEQLFDELIESSDPGNMRMLPVYKCNLAIVYLSEGRYAEAEHLFRDMLDMDTPWWEGWSPRGKPYLHHLGETYLYLGRYEEAERQFKRYWADQGDFALRDLPRLGYVYMAQNRYAEAADLFVRGIEYGNRELPGKVHPTTLAYMNGLAVLHTKQKEYSEAERLLNEVLEARMHRLGDDHPATLETINDFGVLRMQQQQYEEAEKYLLKAVEGRRLKLGDTHPHTLESLHNLIALYEAWGKPEMAEEWRAKLPQTRIVEQQ